MNKQQSNISTVLRRLATLVEEDETMAEEISGGLEAMLNDIHEQDGFGTEGQSDPRGDFREGEWSMWSVEGVDAIARPLR